MIVIRPGPFREAQTDSTHLKHIVYYKQVELGIIPVTLHLLSTPANLAPEAIPEIARVLQTLSCNDAATLHMALSGEPALLHSSIPASCVGAHVCT